MFARLSSRGIVKNLLAHTQRLRGDLDQLVVRDEFHCFLDGHDLRGREDERFVRALGTDGGQMLFLADVDGDILDLRAFADDHALIDLDLIGDEHRAAVLRVEYAVGGGLARQEGI